jgi:hypothetical protein
MNGLNKKRDRFKAEVKKLLADRDNMATTDNLQATLKKLVEKRGKIIHGISASPYLMIMMMMVY